MEKAIYIPKTWDLPEAIRKRLGESVGRQRMIHEEGNTLLLLHQVPRAEDDEVRQAVVFWRNHNGEWKSAPHGGGLSALEAHIALYRTSIHKLDEAVEVAKNAREYFEVMRHMHPLQRATRSMLEVMQAARETLRDDTRVITLRDQTADLERAIELVVADAKAGMDFTLAESASLQASKAEAANQEARRLNRLAAFFFPLATLVAVFGMNSPEEVCKSRGFWVVLGLGVILGFLVHSIVAFGRKRGNS